MKNPLRYQMTEYDCGPTSMLNAVSYLFEREALQPEILRSIMLYSLDCFGADGVSGKCGTSCTAMLFLSTWMNGYGQTGHLPVSSQYLCGRQVNLRQNGAIRDALNRGGVAVVRLDLEGWHYVLLTKILGEDVYLFDPYYLAKPFSDPAIRMIENHPCEYNRIVPIRYLEQTEIALYAFGPLETRDAVILFNNQTVLTEEKTVEYII